MSRPTFDTRSVALRAPPLPEGEAFGIATLGNRWNDIMICYFFALCRFATL